MQNKYKILNRDMIKYLAVFAMLLNHIAYIFLEEGTPIFLLFVSLGHFTAITMICFLVEGYHYTHSKKRYFLRLLGFALLSQIPYSLAFTENGILSFTNLNMLFTLVICFGILWINENIKIHSTKYSLILILMMGSYFCDWSLLAPIFTCLFIGSGNYEAKKKCAFLYSILAFGSYMFLGKLSCGMTLLESFEYIFIMLSGMVLAAICILYFYNGKHMKHGRIFSKWFFYWFYPIHLLVLGIIRIFWRA